MSKCWNCGKMIFYIRVETDGNEELYYMAKCENCGTEFDLRDMEL